MRIRTIKPEFYLHEGLFELERDHKMPIRLAFSGLWGIADREGRFRWEPRKIGVQILPYDLVDFSRVLDALVTRGFVVKYSVDSVDYGWIPGFARHQVLNNRERASSLPGPSGCYICDASSTRESRVDHAGKAEGKGREGNKEGKGKEGKGEEDAAMPLVLFADEQIEKPMDPPKPPKTPKVDMSKGTLEELRAYAVEIGMPATDGDGMFYHWEANGWRNGSNPVKNWKMGMQKWKSQSWLPSQKATGGQPSKSKHAGYTEMKITGEEF